MSESQPTLTETPTAPADGMQTDGGMGPHSSVQNSTTGTTSGNAPGSNTVIGTKMTEDGGMGPH